MKIKLRKVPVVAISLHPRGVRCVADYENVISLNGESCNRFRVGSPLTFRQRHRTPIVYLLFLIPKQKDSYNNWWFANFLCERKILVFIVQGQSRSVGGGVGKHFSGLSFCAFWAQFGSTRRCRHLWLHCGVNVDVFIALADILLPVTCLATSTFAASPCKVTLFLPLITLSRAVLASVHDEVESFFFCLFASTVLVWLSITRLKHN